MMGFFLFSSSSGEKDIGKNAVQGEQAFFPAKMCVCLFVLRLLKQIFLHYKIVPKFF